MNEIEYVVRVKLPSSASFHSGPSGDTEYEQAYNAAIFAVKPPGFEVAWSSKSTWPVDKDGMTWVKLYCTDHSKALEYYVNRSFFLEKKLDVAREHASKIISL